MMAAHPYESYAKMVDGAKRAESQEQREKGIYGPSRPSGFGGSSSGGQRSFMGKKRGRYEPGSGGGVQFRAPQSISSGASTQGQSSRSSVVCHGCGKPGHIQAHCRSTPRPPPRAPPSSSTACYECGQEGHLRRDCPRLRGAGGSRQGRPAQSARASQSSRVPALPAPQGSSPQGSQAGSTAPRGGGQQGQARTAPQSQRTQDLQPARAYAVGQTSTSTVAQPVAPPVT